MKILALTNLFPTPWAPRRGEFNRQQFERLGERHEVHVVTAVDFRERMRRPPAEVEVAHVRRSYFTYVYPPRIGRALHAACWAACLQAQCGRALRAERFDCVLASWGYPDAVASGWFARRLGIPYVVKLHGSDLNVQASFAARRWQIRHALRHAAGVVAVSRALAQKAVAIGADAARTRVIYNGVDTALFARGSRVDARKRLGLGGSPLVLYVGNLKASKGCLDLVAAFPAVLAACPDARLVFVGEGPDHGEVLARSRAAACRGRVQLVGARAHARLGDWFRAADVLCLPSFNEGVPNVVLEAMACGTPVVATDVGGIPEVVPPYAGKLVPAHDRAALEQALIAAAAHAWDGARIAGHAAEFRWDDNIRQLDAVLQAAVAAPSSRVESLP